MFYFSKPTTTNIDCESICCVPSQPISSGLEQKIEHTDPEVFRFIRKQSEQSS